MFGAHQAADGRPKDRPVVCLSLQGRKGWRPEETFSCDGAGVVLVAGGLVRLRRFQVKRSLLPGERLARVACNGERTWIS